MPSVKRKAPETAEQLASLKDGLKRTKTEIVRLIHQVNDIASAQQQASCKEPEELSKEARQLIRLCLDNDLHEALGTLVVSWDKDKVKDMVSSWSPADFGVVCNHWPSQFTADLLQDKASGWIASACEGMNVEEIAELLPLLKKKIVKSVMGKLYFASDDRYLSESECRSLLLSLREDQRQAVIRKFGDAASEMLEATTDDSEEASESEDDNAGEKQSSDEFDSSFIDDDEEDDGGDDEDDDDEDYLVDVDA